MQTISQNSLNRMMYYHNIPVLKYRINYPSFTSTCSRHSAPAINHYYMALARQKEDYCIYELYPQAVEDARYIQTNYPPFRYYEFIIDYSITYNSGCITSLYLDQYTYTGGAHGSTVRISDTWEFSSGRHLQLQDFYGSAPSLYTEIEGQIEAQISCRLKDMPSSYFDDYSTLLRNAFRPESYYLIQNHIVIYYQQYDIAPYAAGIPEFPLYLNYNTNT